MRRTFVIAECGSCHDGKFDRALRLILTAKEVGADVAKFQFWSNPDRLADRRRAGTYRESYRRYSVPVQWLGELRSYCDALAFEFMATTYLPEDIETVAPYVQRFKVSSFESADDTFLEAHAPFLNGKSLLISTGMAGDEVGRTWSERRRHVRTLFHCGTVLKWLHCVSAYPAPIDALNLSVIHSAEVDEPSFDGFSDHSDPALTWTGALAVAAGARIIEAHLKLEDTDPTNPDAPHAMTLRQFTDYVGHIRFTETALGDGVKRLQPCEFEMMQYRVMP